MWVLLARNCDSKPVKAVLKPDRITHKDQQGGIGGKQTIMLNSSLQTNEEQMIIKFICNENVKSTEIWQDYVDSLKKIHFQEL